MTAHTHGDRLAQLLTDAALQALFMRSRRNDLREELRGMKFAYGVDANVVRYWANPRSHAANRMHHIGRVFRRDRDQLATATSWGLLNFIFNHIGGGKPPLLVIPPINTELAAILEALHDTDPDKPRTFVRKELQKLTERLQEQLTAAQLAEINLKLQDLLLQEIGEHGEMRRILLLFTRTVVAGLEYAKRNLPSELRDVVLPSEGVLSQWYDYGTAKSGVGRGPNRQDGWVDRLPRVGSWRLEKLMHHDAEVLARLEVWNRKLIERKVGWRMLYITADHRLFRAASHHHPPELSGASFAEAYLRHPRAYLSEEGVLGPVEEAPTAGEETPLEESVGDWLTLLTQPADASLDELLDTNAKRAEVPVAIQTFSTEMARNPKHLGMSGDDVADELEQKWHRFAQGALVAHPVADVALSGIGREQLRPAHELIRIVNEAHERLEEDRKKTLREYLRVTTRLGRKFEAVQSAKPLIRSVAPVYFEDWREACEAVAIMSHWSDDEIDESDYQRALDRIDINDRTPYAFYLGNAAFFAARGRWRSAALVAKRARRIGLTFRSDTGFQSEARGAHGREAAYFEATCLRHLAEERSALSAARECLAEAEDILAKEKDIGEYDEFAEERLPAERLAIDLTAYQFEALVEASEAAHEAGFRAIADELSIQSSEESLRLVGLEPGIEIQPGDLVDVRLRVELQLLISTIVMAFMPDAAAIDCYRARDALQRIEERIAHGHFAEAALSELDRAVVLAARLRDRLGRTDATLRRRFQETLATVSESDNLLPYEQPLLDRLDRVSMTPWLRD